MTEMQLRAEDGAVSVKVMKYERQNAQNSSDANWLNCRVEIQVPPFSGGYFASFATQDFRDFKQQLDRISEGLATEAVFETDERALQIRISSPSSLGTFVIEGEAAVWGQAHVVLHFKLHADETYLAMLRQSLTEVMSAFPVRN